ncbi:MAG: hypothetical protein P4L71_22685 [Acetobacteraceae bacterium]|nr:hypothetical protein [Acetobacteraceae bacterium]
MEVTESQPAFASPPPAAASSPSAAHETSFHDVLSALNPLQYLPGIGTLYRAVTNDQIPEPVRRIGSAIGSFLLGGPVGVAINLAMLGVEKASGIDFDHTGQALLGRNGPATSQVADTTSAPAAAAATDTAATSTEVPPALAWSSTQLAAYGVGRRADGTLECGDLSGADLLNSMELGRMHGTQIASSRGMSVTA